MERGCKGRPEERVKPLLAWGSLPSHIDIACLHNGIRTTLSINYAVFALVIPYIENHNNTKDIVVPEPMPCMCPNFLAIVGSQVLTYIVSKSLLLRMYVNISYIQHVLH